jgi:hypothetical protein
VTSWQKAAQVSCVAFDDYPFTSMLLRRLRDRLRDELSPARHSSFLKNKKSLPGLLVDSVPKTGCGFPVY